MTESSDRYQAAAAEVMDTLWDIGEKDRGKLEDTSRKLFEHACRLCRELSFDDAITCCKMALNIARQTGDSHDPASVHYTEGFGLSLLGATHLHQGKVNSAIEYFQRAADEFQDCSRYRSASVAWMAIGESYALIIGEKKGSGTATPQDHERALGAFQRSLNSIEGLEATDESTIRLKTYIDERMRDIHRSLLESLRQGTAPSGTSSTEAPISGEPESTLPKEELEPGMPPSGPAAGAEKGAPTATETEQEPPHDTPLPERGNGKAKRIPIVAIVRAGADGLAEQKQLGDLYVDAELARGVTHAVEIEGRSMVEEGIYPKDFVLVHEQQQLEPGELGVFLIIDADSLPKTTLKHYYPEAEHVCLRPLKKDQPILLIIPPGADASRIIRRYAEQGHTVYPYVDADLEVIAKAYGLLRLFDRGKR